MDNITVAKLRFLIVIVVEKAKSVEGPREEGREGLSGDSKRIGNSDGATTSCDSESEWAKSASAEHPWGFP